VSDPADELAGIEAAASGLIQALSERLGRHGLGEIEVRRGELRVRVAAAQASSTSAAGTPATAAGHAAPSSGAGQAAHPHGGTQAGAQGAASTASHGVTSPAVGYFAYIDGLGPGLAVEKGDPLGFVDVLGVRHDVRAPRSGIVRGLVTESGEAVEYGQLLIELEAAPS
jgi:acetyl-CoA carboxylase biotin carboxyl carrier protein